MRDVASIRLHDEQAVKEAEAQTSCSVFLMADIDVQATADLKDGTTQTNHETFQVASETQVELTYADEAN